MAQFSEGHDGRRHKGQDNQRNTELRTNHEHRRGHANSFRHARAQHAGVLVITHDQTLMDRWADRIVDLDPATVQVGA
ncbi:hypothetical protein AB0C42_20370 [Micromonospora taraxaci]|uniref:hypothetical protein n=1 Tax=Micromonospora taraxaci TaxID=1316803 RepID=UPI0033FADB84